VDPITIAAGVVALLTPFVSKAADAFASEAGKAVWSKTSALFDLLKSKLSGDQAAAATLDRFDRNPQGSADEFQSVLVKRLEGDQQLRDELLSLLDEIKRSGPNVRVVQRVKEAQELVGLKARRVRRGSIEVTQDAERVNKATGAEIDEIG
jgi:hypothetical protein